MHMDRSINKQTRAGDGGDRGRASAGLGLAWERSLPVWRRDVCWADQGTHISHLQTLIIFELGFKQNLLHVCLILPIKIVFCCDFPWNKFKNHKCINMTSLTVYEITTFCYISGLTWEFATPLRCCDDLRADDGTSPSPSSKISCWMWHLWARPTLSRSYLTVGVYKVVLQKSIPAQICQLILLYS